MDKNGKYWGFMEQNEADKDAVKNCCWQGDNLIHQKRMEKDKNSKYWGYMEQNEAVKDAIQPDIGVGKEIILLI